MQVYLLTNLVNGRYYVGRTVNPDLHDYLSVKRWAARHDKVPSMPLIRAMRKYGVENFKAEVLTTTDSIKQLDELERLWIAVLDAQHFGYNVAAGGSGASRPCSEDTKRKIGIANKGRKPAGYVRTEKHKQQLSERPRISRETGYALASWENGGNVSAYLSKETPEQKAKRYAAIKASWVKRRINADSGSVP